MLYEGWLAMDEQYFKRKRGKFQKKKNFKRGEKEKEENLEEF